MSKFLHLKDSFDNDIFFGDCNGELRLPPFENVEDYGTQLQKLRKLDLRPDDVIIVGYPKSGNNWIHHIVSLLQRGATCTETDEFFATTDKFPYMDGIGGGLKLAPPDRPRSFFSHLPFRFLPSAVREKEVKVVYVTRNPKDVFVSLYGQLGNMHLPLGYSGTWPQFFSFMLEQGFWYGDVFEHLKDWEKEIELHPQHPILECNYEDTKQDTLGQVERLNQFLGLNRSRELCQKITEACTFGNMHLTRTASPTISKSVAWKEERMDTFFRKGMVGDWKNWFTVAQNEQFDDVYADKMSGYKRTFVFE